MALLDLPNGYYELPRGKLVNVVTCLEMLASPGVARPAWPQGFRLKRFGPSDIAAFRALFRAIGEDLMWFSRLIMAEDRLAGILGNPAIESFGLYQGDEAVGLLELNFEEAGQCELAFFGLAKALVGQGLGRLLMQEGLARAWERPITRLWVHTCHYDHPRALGFYKASGFVPYAVMIEAHDDPRLSGHLPLAAAPHVPLIKP
ncbi:MAG: GNAT family N-acetyltransferase [Alphaproteobacteria bacterium]|nr:GNAT family N-acetyltransferase [Alphaproteobacteria bacterium]